MSKMGLGVLIPSVWKKGLLLCRIQKRRARCTLLLTCHSQKTEGVKSWLLLQQFREQHLPSQGCGNAPLRHNCGGHTASVRPRHVKRNFSSAPFSSECVIMKNKSCPCYFFPSVLLGLSNICLTSSYGPFVPSHSHTLNAIKPLNEKHCFALSSAMRKSKSPVLWQIVLSFFNHVSIHLVDYC